MRVMLCLERERSFLKNILKKANRCLMGDGDVRTSVNYRFSLLEISKGCKVECFSHSITDSRFWSGAILVKVGPRFSSQLFQLPSDEFCRFWELFTRLIIRDYR
jgi:hypothetical protein